MFRALGRWLCREEIAGLKALAWQQAHEIRRLQEVVLELGTECNRVRAEWADDVKDG